MIRTLSWLIRGLGRRARRALSDAVPDRVVLARRFKQTFGRRLDLRNPRTFNEKLYWMMMYYRPPLMSQLADKYAVRSYVAERVGPHILNELYGVWDRVADLDFAGLPDTFVLKVNWGWRMNLFIFREAWWSSESPLNRLFNAYGRLRRKEIWRIYLLKLRFCGTFGFLVRPFEGK